ncbi:hypothetical protein SISSUDRAFT_988873, partial [Sistotremastrum suecicum HHB10207 ss-3]
TGGAPTLSMASKSFEPPEPDNESRIPITPGLMRSIFASSRTSTEERSISRIAFFRFSGFLLSCLGISLAAARRYGRRSATSFLGAVV